jgi:hypothetical protein
MAQFGEVGYLWPDTEPEEWPTGSATAPPGDIFHTGSKGSGVSLPSHPVKDDATAVKGGTLLLGVEGLVSAAESDKFETEPYDCNKILFSPDKSRYM